MTSLTAPEPAARERSSSRTAPPDSLEIAPKARHPAGRRVAVIVIVLGALFAAALVVGLLPRLRQARELNIATVELASTKPRVSVAVARQEQAKDQRVLPGNALPLLEASLYARTTGYVSQRLVDIGQHVGEGELLAVIDSPETDDHLVQATADLNQAKANLELNEANAALAKTTLARFLGIQKQNTGAVSQQDIDEREATVRTTEASVDAARANIGVAEATVQRYKDLQRFEKVTAPFSGVLTARHIDPGDLVSADNTQHELFHLMRTDVIRVFVNVPQTYATTIKPGQTASVFLRDQPGKKFASKVTRMADALDPSNRTLLTEVEVPNPTNELRPGMYLQVELDLAREFDPVMIPTAALSIRDGGPRVGVLAEGEKVNYRKVELGRDYGAEVEVVEGLTAGESVIVHPGDDLADGTAVDTVPIDQ